MFGARMAFEKSKAIDNTVDEETTAIPRLMNEFSFR
jgi:hypothetical protein